MKSIKFYITLLFLISSDLLFCQETCLQNGSFTNACNGTVTIGGCDTWSDNCGDGWVRSHGTPQMVGYPSPPKGIPGFYAFMWSKLSGSSPTGEGMYTQYTFRANHTYNLRFMISAANANGSILFYAANGLTQSQGTTCGEGIPNISQSQLIGHYDGTTNSTTIQYDPPVFTPSTNFSFIWIYPTGTSSTTNYDVGVFSVESCPSCDGVITYNVGSVPSGETRAGNINAGSTTGTGGSGTVTVQPTQTTTFIATHEVDLLPEFDATATTGSFDAQAIQCQFPGLRRAGPERVRVPLINSNEGAKQGDTLPRPTIQPSQLNGLAGKVRIYPTISSGTVTIENIPRGFNRNEVLVLDEVGRRVHVFSLNQSNLIVLNLSNLKNGIYFIQLKGLVQKVVISK